MEGRLPLGSCVRGCWPGREILRFVRCMERIAIIRTNAPARDRPLAVALSMALVTDFLSKNKFLTSADSFIFSPRALHRQHGRTYTGLAEFVRI